MPITAKQLEARKKRIGSSDLPSILGVNPYATPFDVWLEKTGQLEPENGAPSEAAALGTALEGAVLDDAEKELGPLRRNQARKAKGIRAPIVASIDALVRSSGQPVEAKTCSIRGWSNEADLYGDEGTDQVPDRVTVQTHAHMLCVAQEVCHVPVLIGGRGLLMFRVERSEALIRVMIEKAEEFWFKNVIGMVPPIGVPSLPIARRVRREPKKIVQLDGLAIAHWLAARQQENIAKKGREKADAELLVLLGDAEACCMTEAGCATFYEQEAKRFDSKRFKVDYPKLFAQYTKVSKSRVLRLVKPKK